MAKAVALGEMLLRLSPIGNKRFIQADELEVYYGGGEANIAVSLANYGHEAELVTKLPDNPIGYSAESTLKKLNVGTKNIAFGGDRMGLYFLENGAAMRASNVIYDRAGSSASTAEITDFDFDKIFENANIFVFTGIMPAISEKAALLTEAACIAAKKKGITVACDYNYRKKLWTREKAVKIMTPLMQYVDIFFGGIDDACGLLGREKSGTDTIETVFAELSEAFDFKYAFATNRESHSASDNTISAFAYSLSDKELYASGSYRISPIVDRVGGGDAFTGGVLCGLLDGKDFRASLDFGIAASALKHTVMGDFNLVSRSEVDNLVNGDGSGRVQR